MDFTQKIPGSKYFTWHEACFLPQWNTHHIPNELEQEAIIEHARRLDAVRDFLGKPIKINCWIRPIMSNTEDSAHNGQNYNLIVHGAVNSSHIPGQACDFEVSGISVDEVMKLIAPKLNSFQLSAENNGTVNGRNWIHLQSRPLSGMPWRIFNP